MYLAESGDDQTYAYTGISLVRRCEKVSALNLVSGQSDPPRPQGERHE